MERIDIVNKVTEIFRDVFKEPELVINDEMTANDVEKWDSLSNMAMVAAVENTFGIKFKLKDLNKLKKVGDLISVVESKL